MNERPDIELLVYLISSLAPQRRKEELRRLRDLVNTSEEDE